MSVARRAGYHAVDLPVVELAERDPLQVTDGLRASGLEIGGVALPVEFRQDDETFHRDLGLLPKRAAFAQSVGVSVMGRAIPASWHLARHEAEAVLRERISACAKVLADHDIRVALEFLGPFHLRTARPHQFIWTMDDTATFARSCGPSVGLLVDAWHWHHAGATGRDITDAADLILHVQVADSPRSRPEDIRDEKRAVPGQGVIDLPGFFGALRAARYTGPVTPEIFGFPFDAGRQVEQAASVRVAVESAMSDSLVD